MAVLSNTVFYGTLAVGIGTVAILIASDLDRQAREHNGQTAQPEQVTGRCEAPANPGYGLTYTNNQGRKYTVTCGL